MKKVYFNQLEEKSNQLANYSRNEIADKIE